jgi:hypothetical protein
VITSRAFVIMGICLALAACKTTSAGLTPVVKPTGPEWNALATAKKSLSEAQQELAAKQKSLASATATADNVAGGKAVYQPLFEQFLTTKDKASFQAASDNVAKTASANAQAAQADVTQASQKVVAAQTQVAQAETAVDSETRATFDKQFTTVLGECKAVINKYQRGSRGGAETAFWLQMGGLVAGAVAAPALVAASSVANKAWIAGLSGFAGGTNLAETSLGNANLSGISDATTANQLAAQIRTDITTALNKTSWDDRYDALNTVVADCSLFQIGVPTAQPSNGYGGQPQTGGGGANPPPTTGK